MDFLRPVRTFDNYQQARRVAGGPDGGGQEVRRRPGRQPGRADRLLRFFSLFPLLLVFTTILGFVLHGDPSAQNSVEHSVLGQFPIIGSSSSSTRSPAAWPRW